jgi:peroxiredoxin
MPSSYVIDRGGVIRYLHVGFRPGAADDVRRAVEQALSEPVRAP